jgi:septum formation protein
MDGLGLPYEAIAPGTDETVPPGQPVEETVLSLALKKARAVAVSHPEAWVIGADQLAELNGLPLGKPVNEGAARKQLKLLSGQTHRIVTGLCLITPERELSAVEPARITLHRLTDAELLGYVGTGEWQGCAGSYRIEGRGQALMEKIDGDRTNIQGLPMLSLVQLLRSAGYPFFG